MFWYSSCWAGRRHRSSYSCSMKMMYEDESTDTISLVNASNAFNSLDRQLFLHNISYLFPSIAIFVKSCHSTPSIKTRWRRRCSLKKAVLRNFAKFTGKHLCQSLFFNKVADLWPTTLLKKRLSHRCFTVNFVNFLRTTFLTEHLWTTASARLFIVGGRKNISK